ncbi:hypothetical protein LCGC14_0665590 [marine sediment metagenome]|uniref:Uncharacterized protein n=1 Tax=marine sediment metagenome TaxID=412755 RepID=A0A0F9U0I2_9ZZZZ
MMDEQIAVPLPDNLSSQQAQIFTDAYLNAYEEKNTQSDLSARRVHATKTAWLVLRTRIEDDIMVSFQDRADKIPTPKNLGSKEADNWNAAYLQAIDGECRDADAPHVCAAKVAWGVLRVEKAGGVTSAKAKKILEDGEIDGKPLTDKQKKFFGAIAGGQKPRKKTALDLVTDKRAKELVELAYRYASLGHSVWAQKSLDDAGKFQPIDPNIVEELSAILRNKNEKPTETHADLINYRVFSTKNRELLIKAGKAMADGSFPIENQKDLEYAIRAIDRAQNPEQARNHIIKRAGLLGLMDLIPQIWKSAISNDRLSASNLPNWFVERTAARIGDADLDAQLLTKHSGDTIIERPDYIESVTWRKMPQNQKTLRSELMRRAIRRNYFQVADDMRLDGWRGIVLPGRKDTGEMEFRKFVKDTNGLPILMRMILVRKTNELSFYPKVMGRFVEKSTATMLDRGEVRLS